ncbi:MAG: hypothetical protein A3J83_08490 [Elusimicrobia bacterium RIFOXYA2_FULL_40_6]|nr:MAG: hypothetical protein A3J83_08490 [Elusimicrobia bacterium RIFOXYA2_FULL_40_6]
MSNEKHARIAGTGSYLPKKMMTNEELEGLVKNFSAERAKMSFCEWTEKVTGIKTRYFIQDETVEFMAAEASKKAMEAANIKPEEIDFIVAASFTPSMKVPNLACSVSDKIGNGNIPGFVLNTACAGFIYALDDAFYRIRSGNYKNILVVASEALTRATDFNDPTTAVLFADGAGAVILQASDTGGIAGFPYLKADYSADHLALISANKGEPNYIKMGGGPRVLKRAINAMAEAAEKALERTPYKMADINWVIPHQANGRIVEGLAEKLNVPMDKMCLTVDRFGNTSAATIPLALDKAVRGELEKYKIKRGDKLILTSVGGGYAIGAVVLEY